MSFMTIEQQKRRDRKDARRRIFIQGHSAAQECCRLNQQLQCKIRGCPDQAVTVKNGILVCDRHA